MPASPSSFIELLSDDVVLIRPSGDESKAAEIREALTERARSGPFFIIADFTGITRMHSEAGSRGGDIIEPKWIRGAVFVNASMSVKLGLKVFTLAMLLKGQEFPMEHVTSRSEAMAAIERMRAKSGSAKAG